MRQLEAGTVRRPTIAIKPMSCYTDWLQLELPIKANWRVSDGHKQDAQLSQRNSEMLHII